jgi:precorrin-3B synthase
LEPVVNLTAPDERTGRDRCPGVLALHQAADGWLARVRVPGGRLSASQLETLAAASAELGNGLIDLTARANLQLRGLDAGCGATLAERLAGAGLLPSQDHDRARNVLASPLAGRAAEALDRVDQVVELLDASLCEAAALRDLPGRFCFLVDDGSGAGAELRPDVTVAARGAGRFGVLLGGRLLDFDAGASAAVELALRAAAAFLAVREGEHVWRLADVQGGTRSGTAAVGKAGGGAEPAGASAVAAELGLRLVDSAADRQRNGAPLPGIAEQRDGRAAVTALAPLGQLSPALLRALARISHRARTDARLSWHRTVTLVDLDPAEAEATGAALARAGLELDPASGWAGLTACSGLAGCPRALADVRAAAARRAKVRGAGAPTEHWTACERRCGEGGHVEIAIAVEGPGSVAVRCGTRTFAEATLADAEARVRSEGAP